MTDKTSISIGSPIFYLVLFVGLGYFVYGRDVSSLIAIVVLAVLMSIALALSFIPFLGFVVYGLVAKFAIIPWVFAATGLYDTWLISVMFWLGIALGGVLSILFGIVLLAVLLD